MTSTHEEGRPLDVWAWEENPDTLAVVGKMVGVARGLAVVHDEKVVHRDVKEANMLVRDENGEPVLLDFHQGCPSPREIPMKLAGAAVLCVFLTGCATTQGTGGSGPSPSPSPGARPAVKKELPPLNVPGGQMKTTLFYGPWQCRKQFMNQCEAECASEDYKLMGCMWLADIKLDWVGSLVLLPVPVEAGSRYGIYHCCCNYPTRTKSENEAARNEWRNGMRSFRNAWSEKFGEWPVESGRAWPGHHIRDLWHWGTPLDGNNIIPAEPTVHDVFNREYPKCYDGQAPWNSVGPNLPYTDN